MLNTLPLFPQRALFFTLTEEGDEDGKPVVCLTMVGNDHWRWIGSMDQARRLIGSARFQDLRQGQRPLTLLQRLWSWHPRRRPEPVKWISEYALRSLSGLRR